MKQKIVVGMAKAKWFYISPCTEDPNSHEVSNGRLFSSILETVMKLCFITKGS